MIGCNVGISREQLDAGDPDLHRGILRDLHQVVRTGLPLRMMAGGSPILTLRGVVARCAYDDEPASRVAALDGLIRLKLAQFPDAGLQEAVLRLFGAVRGSSTETLTERRLQASKASGYEVHHFRKRVEPRILATLASMLIVDSEGYNRNRAAAPILIPETRRPSVMPQDAWAWEAIEHEECVLRMWAAVYSLRAQLLLLERLGSMGESTADRCREADRALWQTAVLLNLGSKYRAAYGARLLSSDLEIDPEKMLELAGWTPPLSPLDKYFLANLIDCESEQKFLDELRANSEGQTLLARWRTEFDRCPPIAIPMIGDEQHENA
jgi:hypothetical protein